MCTNNVSLYIPSEWSLPVTHAAPSMSQSWERNIPKEFKMLKEQKMNTRELKFKWKWQELENYKTIKFPGGIREIGEDLKRTGGMYVQLRLEQNDWSHKRMGSWRKNNHPQFRFYLVVHIFLLLILNVKGRNNCRGSFYCFPRNHVPMYFVKDKIATVFLTEKFYAQLS